MALQLSGVVFRHKWQPPPLEPWDGLSQTRHEFAAGRAAAGRAAAGRRSYFEITNPATIRRGVNSARHRGREP
jgi:hypothetical protein